MNSCNGTRNHLHAPKTLYVSGDLEILSRGGRVAIVGARKASVDGLKRAARLARLVSEQGAVVVSGLADGIDTAAHEAAIHHGGKTIAVIGTPLDRVYPAKNRALQETIAHSHLLLSQFPPGPGGMPGPRSDSEACGENWWLATRSGPKFVFLSSSW